MSVPDKKAHAKLLGAGLIGSSIEWYDFFVYGTAAALVFGKVFFPDASPLIGTLFAFSTFAVGFVARPVGGILAGHFGDKIGRKPMLLWCLIAMGVATFLIGCLPAVPLDDAGNSVGILAWLSPLLLIILRFIQGLACGGQWGGVVLLLTESAGPKKRGFAGTFGQMGVPLGLLLGNLMMLLMNSILSDQAFLSWGWRVPFWASAALVPVVLYIHLRVEDSPEFLALQREVVERNKDKEKIAQAPLSEAIRGHWRKIVMGAGLLAGTNAAFYVTVAGFVSYGSKKPADGGLGMSSNSILACVMLASLVMPVFIMAAGGISDRIGRRPLILVGATVLVIWAFPFFWLANTTNVGLLAVAILVSSIGQALTYGPLAAFMAELFAPRIRYSGASMAYQLAAVAVSGIAPLVMTWIIAETASTTGVALYLIAMSVITLACAYYLPETNGQAVRDDPKALPGIPA
ncbi:putative major facilitator superfamily transporter [Gordonia araii NBRC 100433]|uniref:Putative major facilitator superfamily transporter n=1 Tax=Gordonia araii NBRC 100433 TaxID=1073574 RepID=G7H3A5_9ACTN|nr:MFS transporter [Gordonia araii]GAB10330.1 putative major facilitator superfamily transporter [Gordonia araii NBRC 100433]